MSSKKPLVCQLGMAGVNFKHNRVDLCYRSTSGTTKKHTSIIDAINDEELCSQRLQLLNGDWPTACYDCEYMEKSGANSYRQRIKLDAQKPDRYFTDNIDPETGKIKNLKRIEFRFDNVCNYACRHCSAEYSSTLEKIIKQNPDLLEFDETDLHKLGPSYATRLENLNEIEQFVKDDTIEIEITGGEPFFQNSFYNCLEKLQPFADRINFIVTTNGSIAGKFKKYDVKGLLKNFKEVYLKVSLDGSKSFYNYFREGGDWDNVIANIKSFRELPNVRIGPIVTISNMQAARLPEVYKDYFELDPNPRNFEAGEVIHPNMLNPVHLPKALKQRYLKEWLEFRNSLTDTEHADRIANFAVHMFKTEERDELAWKQFCSYTDKLDRVHNKRVFDYFPEWEEFWYKA